jgi:dipeptidyl aminopeptidase/acylaminoacyl peptidase
MELRRDRRGRTITQTGCLEAAAIGEGAYDWTSGYGPRFNHDKKVWDIGGTPRDNPDRWRQQSALMHVKNIVNPTLVIHRATSVRLSLSRSRA